MFCFACQSTTLPDAEWCPDCGAATHQGGDPDRQRRFVTILRADVIASTSLVADLEPEAAIARLEPALAAMRGAVRQFGGIVSKELGDGLSAVFGAPIADDNHAPLACHAAIELLRRVAGLGDAGLQVRVGLHSGHVVAYMVSSEFSKVYEVGGPAQHLAARLEAEAGANEIYVSQACQELADGHVRFDYLGHKALRGFNQPLPVYRILGASDLSSWRVRRARSVARFVNRTDERGLLERAARNASSGRQTVLLTGDPGIGKSRLVHEFVQLLRGEGWKLIDAECNPNLQATPFSALKHVLLSVVGGMAPDDGQDPRRDLSAIQQHAVAAVLDQPMVADQQWRELGPHARGQAISDASCALVEGMARRQRTVLLLEDLHWIDRASDKVIAALASLQTPDLLVLLTARQNRIPMWIASCHAEIIALRPLDDVSGMAMLADMLGPSPDNLDLKSRIVSHTANVPLFLEEVCRGLKDGGFLHGQWGDLALTHPVGELGIPSSVQGVIAQRLDRLSKPERSLLQIASALGPRSTEAMLRKVAALPEAALQDGLAALDRAELLVNVDSAVDRLFEFQHEMVRQVTYDSMVDKVRESIHARILATLENEDNSPELPDMLCHHAVRAKDWPKAFVHGRSSARRCIDRSAFSDAITYFETAINALDQTPTTPSREADAVDIRIEARTAFMGAGQIAEWYEMGKDAERRAGLIDDIGRRVAAMTVRAAAQNFNGTPVESVAIGETVVRLAEEWGNLGWLNLAQYGLGQAYFLAGRYREAEQMLGNACARLMSPEASAPIGTMPQYLLLLCCMMKTMTHATLGEIDVADQFQQRAAAIANESNRPFDRVAASYSGGWLMLDRGQPEEAASILEDGLRIAQKHGVRLFQPVIACHLGMAYLEAGLLGRARSMLTEAREEAKSVGYTSSVLRGSLHLAVALNRLGDVQAARDLLRETRNTARQQGFSGLEAETLVTEAMVAPKSTEKDRAFILHALQGAIATATESEARPLKRRAEALLSEMLSRAT